MSSSHAPGLPWWSWAAPIAGVLVVGLKFAHIALPPPLLGAVLIAAVLAAVHHAEVVAHKVGEPFGTLLLAVAVTVIEVGLIVALMVDGGGHDEGLARDTVFAAVMIILTGILGGSILIGAIRHREQSFRNSGVMASLSTLAAMTVVSLVMPNLTTTTPGPYYSYAQLKWLAAGGIALYLTFVFVQTVRHRDYFLPEGGAPDSHAPPPSGRTTAFAGLLLVMALVSVVLIGKALAPAFERLVDAMGAPKSAVGVIVAAIVLLPEGLSALRAATANRLQTSMNLAFGSAIASIGLTIPVVAVIAVTMGWPLALGLAPKDMVLLALSLFTAALGLATGRTTIMQGAVQLGLFAFYLITTVLP
jgi:Ca2+:H+ antiporter